MIQALRDGRSPLVLTERNEHLDCLGRINWRPRCGTSSCSEEGCAKRKLKRSTLAWPPFLLGETRLLLATGRYVGEGFDDARLDTLFLTLPISWHGTIAQYVGRLHRLYDGKREVRVYDYADLNVPMLARMFDRRCRGYEAIGYAIQLPGSAVPGWPADVPLPVDPEWKSQYAASVRRLVRDGVDSPLANLFVHVAVTPPPNAEGADRARSATEAFLYRRLETLADTAGKFRLNAELPDSIRWLGPHGSRPALRAVDNRNRIGRRPTSWRRGRIPARSSQGCLASGERLSRPAVPCRRCWQIPRSSL